MDQKYFWNKKEKIVRSPELNHTFCIRKTGFTSSWLMDSLPMSSTVSMHIVILASFFVDRFLNLWSLSATVVVILDIFLKSEYWISNHYWSNPDNIEIWFLHVYWLGIIIRQKKCIFTVFSVFTVTEDTKRSAVLSGNRTKILKIKWNRDVNHCLSVQPGNAQVWLLTKP